MRLSHCESHCTGPFRYGPCLPKNKDAGGRSASAAAAVGAVSAAEQQPPPVQKIEVTVSGKADDEKPEDCERAAVESTAAPTRSCLKKASCGDGKCAAKGNVQWLDLLGKDLTEVKEFEPSECGDLLDDGEGIAACVCDIQ